LSDASAWSAVDDDERIASRAIAAPDFSFELQGGGQQMLTTAADRRDTLLVLVALPESLARLSELAADRNAFHARRIEVVAVTSTPDEARAARARAPEAATMIAICSPDVAAAYAMFAATADASEARRHAEFLIDRDGRIRAQWRGAPAHAQARNEQILAAAAKAQGVASAPGSSDEHASHDHAAHEHAH
jgi:peroxiredoxin